MLITATDGILMSANEIVKRTLVITDSTDIFSLFYFSNISFNCFFVLFLLLCYFYVISSRFLTNIMSIDVIFL